MLPCGLRVRSDVVLLTLASMADPVLRRVVNTRLLRLSVLNERGLLGAARPGGADVGDTESPTTPAPGRASPSPQSPTCADAPSGDPLPADPPASAAAAAAAEAAAPPLPLPPEAAERDLTWSNTNKLLRGAGRQAVVCGVKTGITPAAKGCLVTWSHRPSQPEAGSADTDDEAVVVVTLGSGSKQLRFVDNQRVIQYAWDLVG